MASDLQIATLLVLVAFHVNGEPSDLVSDETFCTEPYFPVGGRCVYIETGASGAWANMKLHCEEYQGRLLKMDSADFLYDLVQFIGEKNLPPQNYWIGAADLDQDGVFQHIDDTPVKMGTSFWAYYYHRSHYYQEPNQDGYCVEMDGDRFYYLNDNKCDTINMPICQAVPVNATTY